MELLTFGGGPADVTTDSSGNAVGGVDLKVYTQPTGGQRVTELYDLQGNPLSGVVTSNPSSANSDLGRVSFQASASYYSLFLDRGYGQRWQVSAATLGEDVTKAIIKSEDALQRSSEALDTSEAVRGALAGIEANVRLFGAVGDGVHDDAPAFQAAINSQPKGAHVVIPAGTWLLKKDIQLGEGVWLDAQPGAVVKRGHNGYLMSIGVTASNEDATDYPGYSGPSNIRITGGVWDGNATVFPSKASIAHLAHTENLSIERAEFRDVAASHHIEFNAARNVKVSQCRFVGYVDDEESTLNEAIQLDLAAEGGMWMQPYDGTPCRNVLIEQCYFGPSDTPGSIDLARGVGSHASRAGVWHEDIVIRGNIFESLRSFAVRCLSYRNATIENNRVIDCAAGINWRSNILSSPPEASTETIDGVQTGKSQNSDYARIVGNVITGGLSGTAKAIEVRGESTGYAQFIDVVNNTIRDTTNTAESILLIWAKNSTVHGNQVSNVGGKGLILYQAERVEVTDNSFVQTKGAAAIEFESSCSMVSVIGNVIDSPERHGITGRATVSLTLSQNLIKGIKSGWSGVFLSAGCNFGSIIGNVLTNMTPASNAPGIRTTNTCQAIRVADNIIKPTITGDAPIFNGATDSSADSNGNIV